MLLWRLPDALNIEALQGAAFRFCTTLNNEMLGLDGRRRAAAARFSRDIAQCPTAERVHVDADCGLCPSLQSLNLGFQNAQFMHTSYGHSFARHCETRNISSAGL